jgi:uncharacterized membrane protein YhiD involved in acid resistance
VRRKAVGAWTNVLIAVTAAVASAGYFAQDEQ